MAERHSYIVGEGHGGLDDKVYADMKAICEASINAKTGDFNVDLALAGMKDLIDNRTYRPECDPVYLRDFAARALRDTRVETSAAILAEARVELLTLQPGDFHV